MKLSQPTMRASFQEKGNLKFKKGYQERGGKLVKGSGTVLRLRGEYIVHKDIKYRIADADSWYPAEVAKHEKAIVVLGDFVYVLSGFSHMADTNFTIKHVFARNDDVSLIEDLSTKEHAERIVAYLAARRDPSVKAAWQAAQSAKGDEKRAQSAKEREAKLTAARKSARYLRAKTVKSFTVSAEASGPKDRISLTVDALLEDGSKLAIDKRELAFKELFRLDLVRTDTHFSIDVTYLPTTITAFHEVIQYGFDQPNSFVCKGRAGFTGKESNNSGRRLWRGYAGVAPATTYVEVKADGDRTTSAGAQLLVYQFKCGKKKKTFRTSADTEMHVTSVGGNGGYGTLGPNYEGNGGGDGGNGGDIIITADPSVKHFTLKCKSKGGKGGAAADGSLTKGAHGVPGSAGLAGDCMERRGPVSF